MFCLKILQDCKNRHTFVKQKHRRSGAKRREVTHSAELKALCTRTMRSLYIATLLGWFVPFRLQIYYLYY